MQDRHPERASSIRAVVMPFGADDFRGLIVDVQFDASRLPACLTQAEKDVVVKLLEGRSHREIAGLRGTSYRTIAAQLSGIYRKLRVFSSTELIAKLECNDSDA